MGRTFMTNGEDDWNCRGYRGQKDKLSKKER